MCARIDQAIHLYGANVIWLAPVPIPLFENNTYRLALRVEQDPLKAWPFQEMCSQEVLDFIWAEHGYTQEQLIPFLAQFRGLWQKTASATGTPSHFENYYHSMGFPHSPHQGNFSAGHVFDKWRAQRTFRVGFKVWIGEEWEHTIDMHDPFYAVVQHHGDTSPSTQQLPNFPKSYPYAYSRRYTQLGDLVGWADLDLGIHREEISGPDYTITVDWDGYCITTIAIESVGREIRVGLHIEQDSIDVPQGNGINIGSDVEYWEELDGVDTRHYTTHNSLPWTCNNASSMDIGAERATSQMRRTATMYSTCWTDGATYSVNQDADDWTDVGTANAEHFAGALFAGQSYATYTHDTDPGQSYEEFNARCSSLALAGSGYREFNDDPGPMEPFGTIISVSTEDTHTWYDEAIDDYGKWLHKAQQRVAEFGSTLKVTPPKIKISGEFSILDGDGNPVTGPNNFQLYGDLPYQYSLDPRKLTFSDIVSVDAANISYESGNFQVDVHDYESADWFTQGTILMATLNCEIRMGRDGVDAAWRETTEGFDGFSSISEDKFYADVDTYIHDPRTGETQSYQAWLTDGPLYWPHPWS